MEESILLELIEKEFISKYREKLEKNDGAYMDWVNKERKNLDKILNKKQLEAVDSYKLSCDWRDDYIHFQTGIKILNYGVKIGMELQKAFDEQEE